MRVPGEGKTSRGQAARFMSPGGRAAREMSPRGWAVKIFGDNI